MLGDACGGLRTLAQFNEDPELADDTFLLVRRRNSSAFTRSGGQCRGVLGNLIRMQCDVVP